MTTTKSTTTHVTKDHGILKVIKSPLPKKPWIPRALQALYVIHTGAATYDQEVASYGLWKMRAVKTRCVYGHQIEIGETFQLPGNNALNFCLNRDAEFLDEDGRKAKEEALEKATQELSLPVDYQTGPQFSKERRDKI